MDYPGVMKCFVMFANFVCFIASISNYFVGSGRWFEISASTFMLLVTIYGFIVSCQINQTLLLSFTILSGIDFLIGLANGIAMIVISVRWAKFCRGEIYFDNDPFWTCHDLSDKDGWAFVYAEISLIFIALVGRILTGLGAFLMAKYYFDGFQREENK